MKDIIIGHILLHKMCTYVKYDQFGIEMSMLGNGYFELQTTTVIMFSLKWVLFDFKDAAGMGGILLFDTSCFYLRNFKTLVTMFISV